MYNWQSITKEERRKRVNLQVALEQDQIDYSLAKYWKTYDDDPSGGTPEQALIWQYVTDCSEPFAEWLRYFHEDLAANQQGKALNSHWTAALLVIEPATLSAIVISEILNTLLSGEILSGDHGSKGGQAEFSYQPLAFRIGKAIKRIVSYRTAKADFNEDWKKQSHFLKSWEPKRCIAFTKKFDRVADWSKTQTEDVGNHMLHIASKSSVVNIDTRFIKKNRGKGWKKENIVSLPHEIVNELVNMHQSEMMTRIIYRPMIVPPVDHELEIPGGMLDMSIRKPTTDGGSRHTQEDLDALNAMQRTEWAVNTDVLDIMNIMFKNNYMTCNMPPRNWDDFKYEVPFPEDGTKQEIAIWKDAKATNYGAWYKTEQKRLQMAIRLGIAHEIQKLGTFWHGYTMDFRGRAYTLTPMLSPQSGDFDRGLIMFAKANPVDDQGLYWIKVNLANLMDGAPEWNGVSSDKAAFYDRAAWVDANHDMLLYVADNPLEMQSMWCDNETTKKNPSFQRLAAIKDYALAVREGVSKVPVQLDGACNGSQHWSAIRRDPEIARLTNVSPGDKPQDLYQYVADISSKKMFETDDSDPENWAYKFQVKWPDGLGRKLVKRATMCDAYGITPHGVRKYVREEGHLKWVTDDLGKEFLAGAVNEMTSLTLHGLDGAMVMSNEGKEYVRLLSDAVSSVGKPLQWTVPTGFRVMHKYPEYEPRVSQSTLYNKKYRMEATFGQDNGELDAKGANLGIPPNFIHSLDASHLRMSVNRMTQAGITQFSMIHDSFGCPASDVETMRQIIKETFFEIHIQPQLTLLHADAEQQFGSELPEPPAVGSFDIGGVLRSNYLFG
jgi:DNA-directed RNA polymerase